ncbi:MAG: hypothetical protein L6R40_004706 [Gallowayella cf. fulva]|nr:MAG: hypothetical protein L6R40_004706 [Xanthomendoza cf. fulva]
MSTNMTTPAWPTPPNLAGRPLDTALLLNRDYQLEIHNRLNSIPDESGIGLPSHVFHSFANTTKTLIHALCNHCKIQHAALGINPVLEEVAPAATPDWPQAPGLQGRPLDTALLLNRDHTRQIAYRLQNHADDPSELPIDVWCPFSKNAETLIKALCHHGKIQLNSLNAIPKIKDATNSRQEYGADAGSADGNAGNASREPVGPAGPSRNRIPVKVEERSEPEHPDSDMDSPPEPAEEVSTSVSDQLDRADVDEDCADTAVDSDASAASKEEDLSEYTDSDDDMESTGDASDSSAVSRSTPPPPPMNDASRKAREVIIRHVGPEVRSKLLQLTRTQLRKRLQSSIRDQKLKVVVHTCCVFKSSGDIRLWTTDAESVKILRRKWKVNNDNAHGFGPEARVYSAR